MKKQPDLFIPFLLEEDLKDMGASNFDQYLDEMGKPGVWGGNLELLALSLSLSRSVVVHQAGEVPFVMSSPSGDENPLHVAYDGQHYDAVVGTLTVPPSSPTPLASKSPSIGDPANKPSAKEVSVLNAFPDSDLPLPVVRTMLEKHKGRVDDAIEALIEEQSGGGGCSGGGGGGGGGGGVESPAQVEKKDAKEEGDTTTKGVGLKVSKGPSRNKPCPCGSKKPFKACCSLKASSSSQAQGHPGSKQGTSPSELSILLGGVSI